MLPKRDPLDEILGTPPSVLDLPISITLFTRKTDNGRKETTFTFRDLAKLIHNPVCVAKDDLPLLKLAQFGDDRGGGKALRNDGNLLAITGVEGDYDAEKMSVTEAATRLKAAGLAAIIYTSPSHKPDAPRWRVMTPTSGPLVPSERERLCARLNGALGGVLADESFKLSQSYFYGRLKGGPTPEMQIIEGRAIDTAWDLDARAIGKGGNGPAKAGESELLARIARSEMLHESSLALVGIWNKQGFTAEECEQKARAAMEVISEDQRDKRWKERYGDIARLVSNIYEKDPPLKLEDQFEDEPEATAAPSRLRFLTPSQCAEASSREYVVKGLLSRGDVACFYGAPGAGKSLISPHIGYAVAQGKFAFKMRTRPGLVYYVAAEDPHGMRGRIKALQQRHGDAKQFVLVEGVSNLLEESSRDLAELYAAIKEQQPDLVFIDTLAMAFPGLEENTADGMGRVIAVARRLASLGAAVVLIHHDTKAQTPTPRGHSLLNGAIDVGLQLFPKDNQGIVRGTLSKNRNGAIDVDIAFRIATESMGEDEDGDPINYALVSEMAPGTAPKRQKHKPSEKALLDILATLRGSQMQQVTEDQLRAAGIDSKTLSGSDEREHRKRAFNRTYAHLLRSGTIRLHDGFVKSGSDPTDHFADQFTDMGDPFEEGQH